MKTGGVLCCFMYFFFSVRGIDAAEKKEEKIKLTDVDPFLESLRLEQWGDNEKPCVEAMLSIVHGVKNSTLWATWVWDAMQRPTGFLFGSRYQLGSFDQCMKLPWLASHPQLRTQYCLTDVRLTDVTPRKLRAPLDPYTATAQYFENTSPQGRYFNTVSWGVCLPSACSQLSVHKVLRAMLRTQHLPVSTPDPQITVVSCEHAGETLQYSAEFKAFFFLLFGLFLVSMLATFYPENIMKISFGNKLVDLFDCKRNWKKLTEEPQDDIASVNGIKILNAFVVTKNHYVLFINIAAVINGLEIEGNFETTFGTMMTHIDIVVDTFFFISGLLLVNGLYGRRKNPTVGLIKRYIRMLGPLAVIVFYFASVHKYVGSGPLWLKFSLQHEQICRKNWWINFSMLNNYIRCTEICHMMTWYIAADFQLAVVGSCLFYIYQNYRSFGKWLVCLCLFIAMTTPAFLTYWYQIEPLFINDPQKMIDIHDNEMFLTIYMKAYCRATVYLLGMLLGYYMCHYKPKDYRNTISKMWSSTVTAIAFLLMIAVMYIGGILYHREYDVTEATVYVFLEKIPWAVGIGSLIFISEYGYAPIVTDILRFKLFGVASKLCYGIYLIHGVVLFRIGHSARSPMTHEYFNMLVTGIGVFFYVLPFAVFMYLFVEAPAGNLANYIFKESKSTSSQVFETNEVAGVTDTGAKSKLS